MINRILIFYAPSHSFSRESCLSPVVFSYDIDVVQSADTILSERSELGRAKQAVLRRPCVRKRPDLRFGPQTASQRLCRLTPWRSLGRSRGDLQIDAFKPQSRADYDAVTTPKRRISERRTDVLVAATRVLAAERTYIDAETHVSRHKRASIHTRPAVVISLVRLREIYIKL